MTVDRQVAGRRNWGGHLFRRFLRRRDGAAAIEFAFLSIPFVMIVFASAETFVAYMGEQLLANANQTMARKIRTGEITFGLGKSTDLKAADYRKAFCEEISILMPCSEAELKTPSKLFLDVRTFSSFADVKKSTVVPLTNGDLDTSAFSFAPGGKQTINVVRAYYKWDIMTDLIRPYITNLKPTDGSTRRYLMVDATVVQNENYP
ncbi:TadE/TadG family type IV pilus assembly protein [Sinorhizobium sp. BG8]|uniref:TadE/TadG family type IV pilus assembly protein n=1 Tax=Sinorhizobium sp. BG8 TaxID=2613773 RepID=UPI00193DA625|nr:TadE/TadG family type IV pilus assembly protein [Sinorhizobium sp. BG8]QRM53785.1 pilus assembly protein [Sinorhizobium sp. BG8]